MNKIFFYHQSWVIKTFLKTSFIFFFVVVVFYLLLKPRGFLFLNAFKSKNHPIVYYLYHLVFFILLFRFYISRYDVNTY